MIHNWKKQEIAMKQLKDNPVMIKKEPAAPKKGMRAKKNFYAAFNLVNLLLPNRPCTNARSTIRCSILVLAEGIANISHP